jgi:hypothetical protein
MIGDHDHGHGQRDGKPPQERREVEVTRRISRRWEQRKGTCGLKGRRREDTNDRAKLERDDDGKRRDGGPQAYLSNRVEPEAVGIRFVSLKDPAKHDKLTV